MANAIKLCGGEITATQAEWHSNKSVMACPPGRMMASLWDAILSKSGLPCIYLYVTDPSKYFFF